MQGPPRRRVPHCLSSALVEIFFFRLRSFCVSFVLKHISYNRASSADAYWTGNILDGGVKGGDGIRVSPLGRSLQ